MLCCSVLLRIVYFLTNTFCLGDPKVSYINASPIGFAGLRQRFIATQAPMTNSFVNFWQMVIEKKVKIVVNLTSVEKDHQYGAEDKYFPDKNNQILNLENNIKLELKKTEVKDLQVKRYLFIL